MSKIDCVKKIKSQFKIESCSYINQLPFDFYVELENNQWFLIEYQGQQHYKPVKLWDGDNEVKFIERQKRDLIKKSYCEKNDILLLIISYNEYKLIEDKIIDFIITNFPDVNIRNEEVKEPNAETIQLKKKKRDFKKKENIEEVKQKKDNKKDKIELIDTTQINKNNILKFII